MGGGVGFSKGCQWSNRVWASMVGGGAKGLGREQKKKEGLEWKTSQLLPPAGTAQNCFLPLPPFLPTPLFISSKFCNRVHTGFLLQNSQILRSFSWTKLLLSQKHSLNPKYTLVLFLHYKYTLVLFLHYPAFGPLFFFFQTPPAGDYPWTIIKFPRP